MKLSQRLIWLMKKGCYPCISYRGAGHWRAHVNGTGNFWCEGNTPAEAMEGAVAVWKIAKCPMDGYAATEQSGPT